MPDSPDYSLLRVQSSRVSLQDMGELAVRLGAASRLYRDGTTIYYDNFRHGFSNFKSFSTGTGSSVKLIANHSLFSPYQVRFITPDVAGGETSISKTFTAINTTYNGFEIGYVANDVTLNLKIFINRILVTGTKRFEIVLNGSSGNIEYLNSGATYTAISTLPSGYNSISIYHTLKVIVDPNTGKYVKLIYDDYTYDLSDILGRSTAGGSTESFVNAIYCQRVTGVISQFDVGHVIFTADEP